MWHSGLKCQRIGASIKASHKRLKVALALGVKKLGPAFVALKLGEFPLFDSFFDFSPFNLDDFQDLAIVWPFDLLIFGSTCFDLSLDLSPPPISPTSLAASTCDDMVVFSIDVSGVAILLKLFIN